MNATATTRHAALAFLLVAGQMAAPASAYEQPAVQQLQAKDHIVIFGDSTTAGGLKPTGYVQLLNQAMEEQIPGVKVSAICKNTRTTDSLLGPDGWILGAKFFEKLRQSEPAPTISIIVLGLNDSKAGPGGVEPYTRKLREAVGLLRERRQTVILTTPTLWAGYDQTKPYAEAARVLATELKCPLIDLYAAYADHVTKNMKDGKVLTGTQLFDTEEPVIGLHLGVLGNTLSAQTILKALGLKPDWKKYQLCLSVKGKGQIKADPAPSGEKERPAYDPGTKVTLTFTPDAGAKFVRWFNFEGTVKDTTDKVTVTMDRPMWIFAESSP